MLALLRTGTNALCVRNYVSSTPLSSALAARHAHTQRLIPAPRTYKGETETVESFLNKIGRDAAKYKDKFGSWEELFTATSEQMKEKGLTIQTRRYIALWTERYRRGEPPRPMPSNKKERLARKAANKK